MAWSVREILNKSAGYLASAGLDSSRLEAELLVGHALGLERMQLYVQYDRPVSEVELKAVRVLLLARAKERRPVAYLTGHRCFLGLDLLVPAGVFIPRPETEELVETAAEHLAARARDGALRLLDLCTGTGAVALALARRFPSADVTAVDLAPAAVETAMKNADRLGLADRVAVQAGDLWEPLAPTAVFDAVISNPPYVPRPELGALAPEIRCHEPRMALDGGPDGLDICRRIISGLGPHLRPGGLLALEHGAEQGPALADLARAAGLVVLEDRTDLAGLPRVLLARRPEDPGA